ncbi:hypothetical protein D3C81_2046020 [compost metagenome]
MHTILDFPADRRMCQIIQLLPGFRSIKNNLSQPDPVQCTIRQQDVFSELLHSSGQHRRPRKHYFSGNDIRIHQPCSLIHKHCGYGAFSGGNASG